MNDEILTLDDIATMYRVTRDRARNHIVKQPGFPEIAPGTTWRLPCWSAHKVRQYVRGIFAPAADHPAIKAAAVKLSARQGVVRSFTDSEGSA